MIDPTLMAEAAEACAPVPTDELIATIADTARKQYKLELEVGLAEKGLEQLKKDLALVSEVELPAALAAVGMTEFVLEGGFKVTVADEVYANIPSPDARTAELLARREDAFKYLRSSGNDGLIKEEITVEAGRGENELAKATKDLLDEAGIAYTSAEAVHWSTLRAFVREQVLEKQTPGFPESTFGVHIKKVATIKAPKAKK